MAITASGMADAIYEEFEKAYPGMGNGSAVTKDYLMNFAEGIVKHIVANMEVEPGTFSNQAGNVLGTGKVK